jgi:hypothetical protein
VIKITLETNKDSNAKNYEALPVFNFDFSGKDLKSMYENFEKADPDKPAKKKKKLKFSFNSGVFETCQGGACCGSCPVVCIQYGVSPGGNGVAEQEAAEGFGLADIILSENRPDLLFFFPERSADNGDGYVRILDDFNLGADVKQFFGREIVIKKGKYLINYTEDFPLGAVVFSID